MPQTAEQSGEEWWYSHKNVYNAQGTHVSYVTVGYTSLVSTIDTYTNAQQLFNEGLDSPYNPIIPSVYRYDTLIDGCGDRDYSGEKRTPARGNIGLNDLQGNMIYCKSKTIGALEEVIQDPVNPDYFYVVGAHLGVKPYSDKINFLRYNPTSSNPNDNFSLSHLNVTPGYKNDVSHLYVAKIRSDGVIVWQALYGYLDYTNSPLAAYECISYGYDIIKSSNGNLIVTGFGQTVSNANSAGFPLLLEIDPSTGYLVKKLSLPLNQNGFVPITNSINGYADGGIGHSLIEMDETGNYAVATTCYFGNTNSNDNNYAYIWNIDHDFNISSTWPSNPICLRGFGPQYFNSTISEIKYHKGLKQLLVPIIKDCNTCAHAGNNSANGFVYRINTNGLLAADGINPSPMGPIHAFDLRIGVEETSDGGFVAVSTTRPPTSNHAPPTQIELGYLAGCPDLQFEDWDTDALIVKYFSNGSTQWSKTFDVEDNRARQTEPGDLKRQECLYKITEAQAGGYVISGNSSANFDDNYLAKVYNDCFTHTTYTAGPQYVMDITSNTLWNSSQNVLGKVIVHSGVVLTIAGQNTSIRFFDSKATGIETNLTVLEGGIVNITDGAIVTSLDASVCNNSHWSGIISAGSVFETNKLAIYPNPANTDFTILYNGSDLGEVTYSIMDVLGKVIKNGTINANFLNVIETTNFNEGVYIVTINKNDKIFEQKKLVVVKQ